METIIASKQILENLFKESTQDYDISLLNLAFKLYDEKIPAEKIKQKYLSEAVIISRIATQQMSLRQTSLLSILLYRPVKSSFVELNIVEAKFGKSVSEIIEGLIKLSKIRSGNISGNSLGTNAGMRVKPNKLALQSENFLQLLLTVATDIRSILIRLAIRLGTMRTLGEIEKSKRLEIARETYDSHAVIAHRLGLYNIKSELEDLSMSYLEPVVYRQIEEQLRNSEKERNEIIEIFLKPIRNSLKTNEISTVIKSRTKAISSIWVKMKAQQIGVDGVYDIFAIRIILNSNFKSPSQEKAQCWQVYSYITDLYRPNPKRTRDWISAPKSGGYESLHTTVFCEELNRWFEVQIRTTRMDDVAENGQAAHWKYKKGDAKEDKDVSYDNWLAKIRNTLENRSHKSLDEYFTQRAQKIEHPPEIFVFTPRDELRKIPTGSSVLDFAFSIHTEVGTHCTGARVGNKNVGLKYILSNGDKVEVLTSKKQSPKREWLSYVQSSKAKTKIRKIVREESSKEAENGRVILKKKFKMLKLEFSTINIRKLCSHFSVTEDDFFAKISMGHINMGLIQRILTTTTSKQVVTQPIAPQKREGTTPKSDLLDIDKTLEYYFAKCCNPMRGDEIFGFVTVNKGIKIHQIHCPNASDMKKNYPYRMMDLTWNRVDDAKIPVPTIKITGTNRVGIINRISEIISMEWKIEMKEIRASQLVKNRFEIVLKPIVKDTKQLDRLIKALSKLPEIQKITRSK